MKSYKHLFQRALGADPDRLHAAAHSHHLWPDASYIGQIAAWEDAARLADRKWDRVMGEIWPGAQAHVANELHLPNADSIVFASNTHDLLIRLISAHPAGRPLRILSSGGEFHSFRRQAARWHEAGAVQWEQMPAEGQGFARRFIERAAAGQRDLIFVSQVMFESGSFFDRIADLAALSRPGGPWVVIDGYHGFMAVETNLSPVADRIFYLAGGYKYAMAGEGAAFMHAPPGFGPRPEITGWYAAFDQLTGGESEIGYAPDARRFLGATFDPSGLYRFVAVRDMLAEEGLSTAAISAHVAALQERLLDGIGESSLADAMLLNPSTDGPQARFLAFRSPHASEWKAQLDAEDIIVDVRGDVLRIGFGLYNDERDGDRLVEALRNLTV